MTTTNKTISPSTVAVSADVRKWVLRIVIAIAVIIALAIIASIVLKHDAQKQLSVTQSVSRSAEVSCTTEHSCIPERTGTGTKNVSVLEGNDVCFDPSFWNNLPRLGYMTSYKGAEEKYNCTREQAIAGTCTQRIFDSFRFVPENGVSLPRYWFVKSGGKC